MAIKITSPGLPLSGGTVTGPILFPAGSATAPSIAWSADADGSGTGFYRHAANYIGLTHNGTAYSVFGPDVAYLKSSTVFGWYSTTIGTTPDTLLSRNADGILQLKSGRGPGE